jgi:hypothetical protein
MSRRAFWILAGLVVVGAGIAIGAVGERTRWFGLRARNLAVADCRAVTLIAPYGAWEFHLNADGSAVLKQGSGVGVGGFGFGSIATLLDHDPKSRCAFPAGTFDFAAVCRDLLVTRQPGPAAAIADYPDMPYHVVFGLAEDVRAERADPVMRDRYRYDEPAGRISPAEGAGRYEMVRRVAVERGLWPPDFEAVWPYPPVPWNRSLGVPKGLRVQMVD